MARSPFCITLEAAAYPPAWLSQHCKKVRFDNGAKSCYGIGFCNNAGDYDIRKLYFKRGSSPKDVTTFRNSSASLAVFEFFSTFYLTCSLVPGRHFPDEFLDPEFSFVSGKIASHPGSLQMRPAVQFGYHFDHYESHEQWF